MKIILGFTLGTKEQHAYINDNGEVYEETFDINDTVDFIFSHPNVTDVTFVGPSAFLSEFAQKAKERELATYGINKIEYKLRSTFVE